MEYDINIIECIKQMKCKTNQILIGGRSLFKTAFLCIVVFPYYKTQ
jgi:hypothetical protein